MGKGILIIGKRRVLTEEEIYSSYVRYDTSTDIKKIYKNIREQLEA